MAGPCPRRGGLGRGLRGDPKTAADLSGVLISCTQINLHHCRSASTVLAERIAKMHTTICLIQEPWVYNQGGIRSLYNYKLFRSPNSPKPRACITVKGLEAYSLLGLSTKDLMVVKVRLPQSDFTCDDLIVSSVYLPYEDRAPTPEMVRLIDYCQFHKLPFHGLLLGGDVNAHHHV